MAERVTIDTYPEPDASVGLTFRCVTHVNGEKLTVIYPTANREPLAPEGEARLRAAVLHEFRDCCERRWGAGALVEAEDGYRWVKPDGTTPTTPAPEAPYPV